MATRQGTFAMHVWITLGKSAAGGTGERAFLPGSPFTVSVHAKAAEPNQQVVHEVIDVSGIMPGDYKVDRAVFDEAQVGHPLPKLL